MAPGRLSSRLSILLQGKHKPIFTPGNDCGDYCVVTNVDKMVWSGSKAKDKTYYNHNGYRLVRRLVGELKSESEPLWRAVSGMLPKNRLRDKRLGRLKLVIGDEHPYAANIKKSYV